MTSPLIVALDFNSQNDALRLVEQLDPALCALKVGSELFTRAGGIFVQLLVNKGYKVFLDLKFHDIPHTVAMACKVVADLGVWMLNVHASGGVKMMEAASYALGSYGANKPLLIAVTVLTSFNQQDSADLGIVQPIQDQVLKLGMLAKHSGLDGVVCSAMEVNALKKQCGSSFVTVTPGIRLDNDLQHDQSRVMTPQQAIKEGSDYIVMGRPISQSPNPLFVISTILKNLRTL